MPKLKPAKKLSADKVEKMEVVGTGDNSGVVVGMVEIVDEILILDEKIKELNKAKRDLRNKAKNEFGVLAFNLNEEVRFRKLDRDVRIQYESGRVDLQTMLGYQASLDLLDNTVARTEEEYENPSFRDRGGIIKRG
jgi:hypothetical protein